MAGKLPTKTGDVLILCTAVTFCVYVVGRVTADGQQDFEHAQNVEHFTERIPAMAAAKTLRGHRTFLRNLDTKDWRQMPG